jgi:hypothetical protein
MDLAAIAYSGIGLDRDRDEWRALVNKVITIWVP